MKKFIYTIIAMLGILLPTSAWAAEDSYREAYAVLELTQAEDGTVTDAWLTLYYDDQKSSRKGTVVDLDKMTESPEILQTRQQLHSVIIDQSFADCRPTNTKWWFAYFMQLKTISGMEYLNTSEVTDMQAMFLECDELEELDLSHFNTSKVKTMASMFSRCSALKNLDLSGFNTANVTTMSSMFQGCMSLTSLNVSSFNTENVTDMTNMFYGCDSLTSLDVSGFNTANVTTMSSMFQECMSLTSLNVSSFNTENVTDMTHMFAGCNSLTSLDLSGFNTDKVTTMYYMFADCSALTSLDISRFNTSNVTTMYSMFADCSALTSLDISRFNTENVTDMTNMFYGCKNLTSLDLTGFKTNSVKSMEMMFRECYALTNLDLSAFETNNVTEMGGMFFNCESLTSLNLSSFNTENVRSISSMFAGCNSLTSLDLSGFNTTKVEDMGNAFSRCNLLKTIYVSDKWTITDATYGYEMFTECTNLVGGAGTKYDGMHTDQTYAHIDGGESNPGYLTDIADKGKEEEQITATPTWAFQENMLILSCETEGAEINYAMENWTTEEEADSISKAMDVIAKSVVYSAPIEVTDNIVIKMYALKEGLRTSKDTTFIYDYKAWSELYDVIRYGVGIAEKATDNAKVDQSLVEELRWALNEGDHMYQMRAEVSSSEAEYFTVAIMEACKKIEEQLNATSGKVETPTFSFNGDSLVISTTTEDALIWYQSAAIDSTYAEGFAQYSGPIVIGDVKMNAKATKEGMEDSEVASMVYYYTEWQDLIETTYQCSAILSEIEASKPSDDILAMIQSVYVEIANIRDTYESDRLSWDREKILEEKDKLRMYTLEVEARWKEESANATYEGTVLTVNGQTTMDAALEQVGGRAEVAKNIAAIVWNSSASLSKSDLEGFIDNPNLLIFVKTDSIAPEGVNNVIIDGKAKTITLADADGNNNFYAPQAFTAESISYTREFKQTTQKDVSRGWEGICLPFDVQTYTHETHGAIAPFRNDASEFHFWLHQMTDKGMTIATTIEANKPYIISMPNSSAYAATYNQAGKVTFAAKNVTIPATVFNEVWTADGKIAVLTTFAKLKADNNTYALNVNDGVDGYEEGSVFISNYRDVRPFEVYTFHEPNRASGSRFISVSSLFGGESDDSTGIIDVMENQNGEVVKVYSINGSLIKQGNRSEVMNNLPKGLYIIGNQKVMVK